MQSNQNEEKIQLFNSTLGTDAVVPLHKPGLAQAGRGGEPGGAGKPACSGPAASPIRQRALPSHPGEESRAVIFPVKQPKFQEWGPGRQTPLPPSPPSHHRAPMRSVLFFAFPPRAFCNAFLPGAGCEEAVASSQAVPLALWASPEPLLVLAAGWAPCPHPKPVGSRGAAARDAQRAEGSNRERGWEGGEGVDADTSCAIKKTQTTKKQPKKHKTQTKQTSTKPHLPSGSWRQQAAGCLEAPGRVR